MSFETWALFTSPAAFFKTSNFQIARPCLAIRPIEAPEAKPDAAHTEVSEEGEIEWQRRVGAFMNMAEVCGQADQYIVMPPSTAKT